MKQVFKNFEILGSKNPLAACSSTEMIVLSRYSSLTQICYSGAFFVRKIFFSFLRVEIRLLVFQCKEIFLPKKHKNFGKNLLKIERFLVKTVKKALWLQANHKSLLNNHFAKKKAPRSGLQETGSRVTNQNFLKSNQLGLSFVHDPLSSMN